MINKETGFLFPKRLGEGMPRSANQGFYLICLLMTMFFYSSSDFMNAATLTSNSNVLIGSNSDHEISVYSGKAAYDGLSSGVFGDNTILDYIFFNNDTISTGGYADGGKGFLSEITLDSGQNTYNLDRLDLWTVTDPGSVTVGIPDFSTTADYGGATLTGSGRVGATGNIDISQLQSGNVYVLCGHYENPFTVTVTMTGPGQPDIVVSSTIDPPNARQDYVVAFDFDNTGLLYDLITYDYQGGASNRSRFTGIVLDGKPPAGVFYGGASRQQGCRMFWQMPQLHSVKTLLWLSWCGIHRIRGLVTRQIGLAN